MSKLAVSLVLAAFLLLAAVPSVPAPPSTIGLHTAGATNWDGRVFAAPVECTSATFVGTWPQGLDGAAALVYALGGTQVINYAMPWTEADNLWIKTSTAGGSIVNLGPYAHTVAGTRLAFDLSALLCDTSSATWTFTRIALIAPGATNAWLNLTFAGATGSVTSLSGSSGFARFARDFQPTGLGAKADVGVPTFGLNGGAGAMYEAATTVSTSQGLLGVFHGARLGYAELEVTGPGSFYVRGSCFYYLFAGGDCASGGTARLTGLGLGDRGRAPAGAYEFRVIYNAQPEHGRVVVVGAPVDWCTVAPMCPST